jgi:hypothetical protein
MNGHFAVRFTDKLVTAPGGMGGLAIIREKREFYRHKIF